MANIQLSGIRVCNRSDSYLNWKNNNPVLEAGEIGMESDTYRIKTGDGSSNWNDLPYTNYTEVAGLIVEWSDSTPKSLFKFPANFFINMVSVSVDEAWLNIVDGEDLTNISLSIGIDSASDYIVSPDSIDLSEAGYTFVYKVNQILTAPTELKAWINGSRTQGKLTINIK